MMLAERIKKQDSFLNSVNSKPELYIRDEEILSHGKRVGVYAYVIARLAGFDREFANIIRHGAILHDIGKDNIPSSILDKPGKLSAAEYSIIKTHCAVGIGLVSPHLRGIPPRVQHIISNAVLYHHERYDGSGYPSGLSGREIPIEANIVSIADIFDALVSKRSYKDAWDVTRAMDLILAGSSTMFYPELVMTVNRYYDALPLTKLHLDGLEADTPYTTLIQEVA